MTPMLEKIARAVDPWAFDADNRSNLAAYNRDMAARTAPAALLAMREPDDETVFEAGRLSNDTSFRGLGRLAVTHTAMIDAILAGETGR